MWFDFNCTMLLCISVIFQFMWTKHPDWQKSCVSKCSILHVHSYPIPVYFLSMCCQNHPIQMSLYRIILLIQIGVKENFVWFVPLLLCHRPPQLSCSKDGSVHCNRDPPSRPSFAASDLLPRCQQPPSLHYHHQLRRWPWGLHGSAREVALFHVCLRYASLTITCYFIIMFTS